MTAFCVFFFFSSATGVRGSSKEGTRPKVLSTFPKPGDNWDPHEGPTVSCTPRDGWGHRCSRQPSDTSGKGERRVWQAPTPTRESGRVRAWLQSPPHTWSLLDRCFSCPASQVAMGTRECELLEAVDKALCFLALQCPLQEEEVGAGFPVCQVCALCAGAPETVGRASPSCPRPPACPR